MNFNKLTSAVLLGLLVNQPAGFSAPVIDPTDPNSNLIDNTSVVNSTFINQQTQNLSLQWNSFNINSNETVTFVQPNTSSMAVNHINSIDVSTIAGQLNANGQIVLINPNGLIFSEGSKVNVGGIVASGLNINSEQFLNGSAFLNHDQNSDGYVINNGTINASIGGSVTLIGTQVENNHIITANLGKVSLAVGDSAVLTFDTHGMFGVEVTSSTVQNILGNDAAVTNNGEITSDGGQVLLTAEVSRDVFTNAVNNQGMVSANSVEMHDGFIRITSSTGDVQNDGVLDVSSTANTIGGTAEVFAENINNTGTIVADSEYADGGSIQLESNDTTLITDNSKLSVQALNSGVGGEINVLGTYVGLGDNTVVNASGFNGGGQVHIGGGFQGSDISLTNALQTIIAQNVELYADAIDTGNGGDIIVWADYLTKYYGSLSANGGQVSGDGGFAEVSGKEYLDFSGHVSLQAFTGIGGTLLLDPRDITIQETGNSGHDSDLLVTPDPDGGEGLTFDEGGTGTDYFISSSEIEIILEDTAHVILEASRDIYVNFLIGTNNGSSNDLTLTATNNINVNASIDIADGDLTLNAGSDININSAITSSGSGDYDFNAGDDVDIAANINIGNGVLTFNSGGGSGQDIRVQQDITLTANTVIFDDLTRTQSNNQYFDITINGDAEFNDVIGISSTSARRFGDISVTGEVLIDGSGVYTVDTQSYGSILLGDGRTATLYSGGQANTSGIAVGTTITGENNNGTLILYAAPTETDGNIVINASGAVANTNIIDNINSLTITNSNSFTVTGQTNLNNTLTVTDTTGAVTFNGEFNAATIATAVQGYALAFNHGGNLSTGSLTTFLNSGAVTFGNETADAFSFNGAITNTNSQTNLFGEVSTTADDITLGNLLLLGNSTISTGAVNGSILFSGTIEATNDHTDTLGLTSGNRDITFNGTVGGNNNELGALTINSARHVNVNANITAASFTATNNSGNFNSLGFTIDTSAPDSTTNMGIKGGDILIDATVEVFVDELIANGSQGVGGTTTGGNGGIITLSNSDTCCIYLEGDISSLGAIGDNNGNGGTITFSDHVDVDASITISTGQFGGDIIFSDDLLSGDPDSWDLTLTAGTGNVSFAESIGVDDGSHDPFGSFTITSANTVTFNSNSTGSDTESLTTNGTGGINISADSVVLNDVFTFNSLSNPIVIQTNSINFSDDFIIAGTTASSTVRLQPYTDTYSVGIDSTANATRLSLTNALINSQITADTIYIGAADHSGDILLGESAALDFTSGGADLVFENDDTDTPTPPDIFIYNNITNNGFNLSFNGDVVLAGDSTVSTGSAAGNILFNNSIDATTQFTQTLTLIAGAGNILFSGVVGETGSELGDITISSANDVTFDLAVTAESIIQTTSEATGTTTFTGLVTTNDGVALGLNLNGANFTFDGGVTTTGIGSVSITNSGVLDIASTFDLDGAFSQNNSGGTGTISLGGIIDTASADITFDNAITLDANSLLTTGTGAGNINLNGFVDTAGFVLSLTTGTGSSFATNAGNDFDNLILTGANSTITDSNGLILGHGVVNGGVNLTGDLILTVGGALTNVDNVVVGGNAFITAGTANNITIDGAGNNLESLSIASANDVTIVDTSGLILGDATNGGVNVSGFLDISLAGHLTDENTNLIGTVVSGLATFNVGASNNITLDNASNNFGVISLTANTASVLDSNAIELGDSTIGTGGLTITTTQGSITNSGQLNITGDSGFVLNDNAAAVDLILDNTTNIFTGSVSITDTNSRLRHVTLYDTTSLDLPTLNIDGDLTVTAEGIAQQAATTLTVAGGSFFDADALVNGVTHHVLIGDTTNDFFEVAVNNAVNVDIGDANNVGLDAISATGTLDVNSGGITTGTGQGAGAADVTGLTTLNTGVGDIVLTDNSNNFSNIVLTANNATLVDTDALILGLTGIGNDVDITTNLDVTVAAQSAGTLTNANTVSVGGNLKITSGTNNATINGAGNNIGSLSVANAFTVTIEDINGLVLGDAIGGGVNTTGQLNVTLTGTGDLTDNDAPTNAISVTGNAIFDVGTNSINLNNTSNNFSTVIVNNANVATFVDANTIDLGDVSVTTLNVTSDDGNITDSGALTIGGVSTFNLNSLTTADLTLDTSTNGFAGTVNISGANIRDVTLFDTTDLQLSAFSASGVLTVNALGITQSGGIQITGNADLTATNTIDLQNTSNNFGTVLLDAATVLITDSDAIDLGATTVGAGGLTVTALLGSITDSDVLSVTGGSSFVLSDTVAPVDLILDTPTNNFTGSVSITDSNSMLRHVTLTDSSALTLPTLDIDGNLIITAQGIDQAANTLTIAGDALFTSTGGTNIVLTNNNDFADVSITNAVDADITDISSIALGAFNVGTLDIIATGITTSVSAIAGPVQVSGLTTLTSNTGVVSLTNAANDFNSVAVNSASTIDIRDANILLVNSITNTSTSDFTADVLNLSGASFSGTTILTLTGLGATSELIGTPDDLTWDVSSNSGTISGVTGVTTSTSFNQFGNLTGSGGDDTFNLAAINDLSGDILGGTQATVTGDSVFYSTPGQIITLTSTNYQGIEAIQISGTGNQLTDLVGATTFTIDGLDTGLINGATRFTGFQTINAGSGADIFDIDALVDGMVLNGGGDNDSIIADLITNTLGFTDDVAGDGSLTNSPISLTFTSIQTFTDDGSVINGTYIINGTADHTTYTLTDNGSVSFGSLSFTGVDVLNAGTGLFNDTFILDGNFAGEVNALGGQDTFQINTQNLTGTILNGGTETNTLSAIQTTAVTNNWQINSTTSGTVNGAVFSDVTNLNGSIDPIVFDSLSSNIAGNIWTINNTNSTVSAYTFNNMDSINSIAVTGNDVLVVDVSIGGGVTDTTATWDVDGAPVVSIYEDGTSNLVAQYDFTGMETLTGGDLVDTFNIDVSTAAYDGLTINGQGENDILNVDLNAGSLSILNILLGDGQYINGTNTLDYNSIQVYGHSGAGLFTLTGPTTATSYALGAGGSVNFGSLSFAGVDILQGGTDALGDTFTLNGNFGGVVNGLGGSDIFEINTADLTGTTLNGTANTESINAIQTLATTNTWTISTASSGLINGAIFNDINLLNGSNNINVTDDLTSVISGNTWVVNANNSTVGAYTFNNMNSLTGAGGVDDFLFNVNFGGVINGLGGADIFRINVADLTGTTLNGGGAEADQLLAVQTLATTNSWTISTASSGLINGAIFNDINLLNGSNNINVTDDLASVISGNTWVVNANNSTVGAYTFNNMNSLTGAGGVDDLLFNVNFGGVVNGLGGADIFRINVADLTGTTLNGGGAEADQLLAVQTLATTNSWAISTASSGLINGAIFNDINLLNGSNNINVTDDLTSAISGNTWVVNANNSTVGAYTFNNMNSLTGAGGVDDFLFNVNFGGVVNGLGGADIFRVNVADLTGMTLNGGGAEADQLLAVQTLTATNSWTISTASSGLINGAIFNDINLLNGSNNINVTDDLTSVISGNTWLINANNSTVGAYTFNNMNSLTGGVGVDDFTLNASLTGDVNGGDGNDIFTINISNAASSINGQNGDDDFEFSNGVTGNIVNGGVETSDADEVIALVDSTWFISEIDAGDINGNVFNDIEVLSGNGAGDTITIDVSIGGVVTDTNANWLFTSVGSSISILDLALIERDSYTISGFGTLNGGELEDNFSFDFVTSVPSMVVNGGQGSDTFGANLVDGDLIISDEINGNGSFVLSNTVTFTDIQIFNDLSIGTGDFTVTGPDTGTSYNLTSNGGVTFGNLSFSGVVVLNGGNGGDTFIINEDVAATINGNDGLDIFQINTPLLTSATQLYGHDSLTVSNDNDRIEGVYDGQSGTVNYGWQINNTSWTVGAAATGIINGAEFYDINRLEGSTNGNIVDTLSSNLLTNSWAINSSNSTVDAYTFNNMENLSGGPQTDTFNFNAAISGDVYGNDGNDIFNVDVDNVAANLYGGNGNDDFLIANNVNGAVIHGGVEVNDSDEVVVVGNTNSWLISSVNGGSVDGNNFDEIEVLTGNGLNDTLTINVPTLTASWLIDSVNTVTLFDSIPNQVDQYSFSGMESLSGGDLVDTFIMNAGVSGSINGGAGADQFNINIANSAAVINGNGGDDSFIIASGVDGQNINGGANNDTLTMAGMLVNNWSINGVVGNNVNSSILFENVETVNGNGGEDIFNIAATVATGDFISINGLGGDDEFIVDFANHDITISGGDQIDTITFSGTVASSNATINDNNTATFTQVGSGETQSITADGIELVEDRTSVTQYNITGSSNADSIIVTDGVPGFDLVVQLLPGLIVNLETVDTVNVDTLGNTNDTITFNSDIDFNGTLNFSAENIVANGNFSVLANNLIFNDFIELGTATNALDIGLSTLGTDDLQLSLDNTDSAGGDVYLNLLSATNLVDVNVLGDLNASISGSLVDSGNTVVTGTLNLSGNASSVVVIDTGSNLLSNLTLDNFLSVTVNNNSDINLNSISVENLSLTTNGSITNSGQVTVSDLLTVSTLNSGDLILNYLDTDSYTVNLQNIIVTDTTNVMLRDQSVINIESLVISDNLGLVLSGDLTQTDINLGLEPNMIDANDLSVSFVDGQYNIVLDQNNDIQTFTALDANQITLNDLNGISVGIVETLSGFDISTTGSLDQTDGWDINGPLNITLSNNSTIDLSSSANTISGLINIDTFNINDSLDSVIINNNESINIGGLDITNDLTLMSNGLITGVSPITVGGVTSLNTDLDATGDSFNVSLSSLSNDFNSVSAINVNDFSISDQNSIVLDVMSIDGDLNINVADNITSSSLLNISGNTLLSTLNGGSIDLNNTSNQFSGDFSLITQTGQFSDVTLNSNGSLIIANTDWVAINDININSEISLTSDLNLQSLNSNVQYSGSIDGFVNLTVNALQGDVLFDQSQIGLQDALDTVSITANTISVGDIVAVNGITLNSLLGGNDINFNTLNSGSYVSITSAGGVFSSNESGLDITATSLAINSVQGVTGVNGTLDTNIDNLTVTNSNNGLVNITDANSVEISSIYNENGSINIFANNSITQTGDIDINQGGGNHINLTAGGAITMVEPAVTKNNFGDITYTANNNIIISELNAPNGEIIVTSNNGNIYTTDLPARFSQPHVVSPDITFNATTGSLGRGQSPFVISSPNGNVVINTLFNLEPLFTSPAPANVITSGTTISPTDTSSLLGGDQRTQFSELSTIDPTIFTEVRNFEEEDTAILLPEDQLYSAEL